MSAVPNELPIADRAHGRRQASHRRSHLVLLPTGHDAVLAARTRRDLEPPLRATRLGRLVIALVVAAAIALLGGGLAGQLSSAGGAPRSVTVVPGDTLSEIAARELPGLPISEGIVEIQLANSLSSDHVSAGQRITVPMP